MDTMTIVAIIVIVGLTVLAVGAMVWASRRYQTNKLRDAYGSEYDRTVAETGDRREAEKELNRRQDRVEKLHIQPLTHDQCNEFTGRWQSVQAEFVDEPKRALQDADGLIGEVMSKRGYPVGEFEQRAGDISVDHPGVVKNYRLAHNISRASDEGNATTEEMRQGMQSYRALFDDLLQTTEASR
ncbi:MAG TPA: hypothetical protein VH951_10460 [Dehalococcoidia bacterium]